VLPIKAHIENNGAPTRQSAVRPRFTLEVEGGEKPCFVGDSVTRVMAPAG
jgi:hypothetical protein